MIQPKLDAEDGIVSYSIIINEIRKFCLKANVDRANASAVVVMCDRKNARPLHYSVWCVRVNYGTTRSLFYMSMCGTFITPVSTIFASTGE